MKLPDFAKYKNEQKKICIITCYDYPSARLIAASSINCVLVGDSVAMAVHGYKDTIHADVAMMVLHTKAVAKGLNDEFIITDLPFLAIKESLAHSILAVKSILQAGAHAVKIEGADTDTLTTIKHLVTAGVPVMGHIGLTPQFVLQFGGYKVQGKTLEAQQHILEQARSLEQAGCFAIVIECVPETLATKITEETNIPTIGIGAGPNTDGQVLVWHDALGLHSDIKAKFVKKFGNTTDVIAQSLNNYHEEVTLNTFPGTEHIF
jgi:3-methyl-2-oxobutanoate hydroxymethyltransferase